MPRILLLVDLSARTKAVLDEARCLHRRWGTLIDAYYLWTSAGDLAVDSCERTVIELEAFTRADGAWETFDELGAFERAGILTIRGYVTPSASGRSIVDLALDSGYVAILYGTLDPLASTARFEIHGQVPRG